MSTASYMSESRTADPGRSLARGLGWFSIALGTAEVLAPRAVARALGMEERERLIQGYGLREIVTGIGILSAKDPTPWVWARVASDALDLATLGTGLSENPKRTNVGIAMAAVAGVTALDVLCGQRRVEAAAALEPPMRDYSDRSGFPRPPEEMRGAARTDFETPSDVGTPEAMKPYTTTTV